MYLMKQYVNKIMAIRIKEKVLDILNYFLTLSFEKLEKSFEKNICQSFFLKGTAGLRPVTLFKKGLRRRCFLVNYPKSLRVFFFTEKLWVTASVHIQIQ